MIRFSIREEDCYIEIESLTSSENVRVALRFPGCQAQDIVCLPEKARVFVAYHLASAVADRANHLSDLLGDACGYFCRTCDRGIQATEKARELRTLLSLWQKATPLLGIAGPPPVEISWEVVPQTRCQLWSLGTQARAIANNYIEQCV